MHAIAGLVAAAAALFGVTTPPAATTTFSPAPPQKEIQNCITISHPLSYGATGNDVSALQTFLGIKPTGYFGHITQGVLIQWQISQGIIISDSSVGAGNVGPKTRAALRCGTAVHTEVISPPAPVENVRATTTEATSTMPIQSGGGPVATQSSNSQCTPFDVPEPPAVECTTGQWQLIDDETGCPVQWDCSDPNSIE